MLPVGAVLITVLITVLIVALSGATVARAGDAGTVSPSQIENPFVDFIGANVDYRAYHDQTFKHSGETFPTYSVIGGQGVQVVGDWLSGSFFENGTNRERFVQRFVDKFSLQRFNDKTHSSFMGSQVRAVHILLYNGASFTLDRFTVWYESSDGGTDRIFSSSNDVTEEEVRDFYAILPRHATRIRVGFKAKGEVEANQKKCGWITLGDVTGAAFKADGALYNKDCKKQFSKTRSW